MLEMTVALAVLAIIGAIGGIGLTAFLGRTDVAVDGAVLDRVMLAEQSLARDYGVYSAWPADLSGLGGGVAVTGGVSTGPSVVSVAVGDAGSVGAAVRTSHGVCVLRLLGAPATGSVPLTPQLPSGRPCAAGEALALADPAESAVTAGTVKSP